MNYWLIKSEPSVYSWERFMKDKKACWDGVRNYAARNNLKAMKKGDKALFYHSNEGLCIMGVAELTKEYYQDPGTNETAWVAVDFKPFMVFKKSVPLSELKADPLLKNMKFIQIPRLSVSLVTEIEYQRICKMGQIAPE